jgi:two-component system cell cycle sensor histidine kinase/response regulator CckA
MATQTEQLYRSLVEQLPLVVYAWTVEPQSSAERALVFSGQIEAMLELSPEEADPSRVHELIHPDDFDRVIAAHDEANRCRRPLSLEYRLLTPSGRTTWVRDESRIATNDQGEVHRHGYIVDISVQRRAELETTAALLREHESHVDVEAASAAILSTIEKISDGFFSFGADSRIRYVNAAGAALVGHHVDELIGKLLWEVVPESRPGEFAAAVARAKEGEFVEIDDYDCPIVGATVELRAFPSPHGAWVFIRDVSDRRRLEQSLRQSQKMEVVGQLAGGIAHDFNNILTAVTGYADFALRDLEREPDLGVIRGEIEEIKRASKRATELTRQLLAFSRQEVMKRCIVDLNDIVRSTERLLRRLIGEHISIVIATRDEPALVEADAAQLEQIVINLALNARDAMPGGGTLTVQTVHRFVAPDEAAPLGVRAGSYAGLSVEDTGVGIGDDVRAQIFAPFFTTKPVGKGTGLGLSTVYGIVRQSGGTIDLRSAPGAGSTFTVYLPAAPSTARPQRPPTESAALNEGTERILLVEDEPVLRELISEMLARKGYDVVAEANPSAAIYRAEHDDFDLLITDVSLPGMSGVDLADTLHGRRARLGVLLISGYPRANIDDARLNNHVGFLAKPFSIEDVASAAREALDRRPPGA